MLTVGLSLHLLLSSNVFFSFEQYGKVCITKPFILKEFALPRIKNFKFSAFKKGKMPHVHMYIHPYNSYLNNKEWEI